MLSYHLFVLPLSKNFADMKEKEFSADRIQSFPVLIFG